MAKGSGTTRTGSSRNPRGLAQSANGGGNIPKDLESAKKLGSVSKERLDQITEQVQGRSIPALREDINKSYTDNVYYYEQELKRAMSSGDMNRIVTAANNLASAQKRLELAKATLTRKNKERKQFLDSTGRTFSDDQVTEYLSKYTTTFDPQAIVKNTWGYRMGAYGNTTATILVGKGKEKPLRGNEPNWRPIGEYSYSVRGWSGKYITIKGTIQSWDDVRNALSETESFNINIYKHPKQ